MLEAIIAPVTPRVHSLCTGDVIPLEDQIQRLLDRGVPTTVRLEGDGRTFALRHLVAVMEDALGEQRLQLHDDAISVQSESPIVIVDTDKNRPCDVILRLAMWCRDDIIEYLLAKHPHQCASVVNRLEASDYTFAGGSPSVWQIILDRMASNPDLRGVESLVLDELRCKIGNPKILDEVADVLLVFSKAFSGPAAIKTEKIAARLPGSVRRLLRQQDVCIAVETDRFVHVLQGAIAGMNTLLSKRHSQARLTRVAKRVSDNVTVETNLIRVFRKGQSPTSATCASLLVRTKPDWRPRGEKLSLRGAYLNDVNWPHIQLIQADLQHASFQRADLTGAQFQRAKIELTDFTEATLHLAAFSVVRSAQVAVPTAKSDVEPRSPLNAIAKLKGVLTRRKTVRNLVQRCRFVAANLSDAKLDDCEVSRCDFSEADLSGANVRHSEFTECQFVDADLTRTDFTATQFANCSFEGATLDSANFSLTQFRGFNLEDMVAKQVCFQRAEMVDASLTGSVLRQCDLQFANLLMSQMALIDWEYCDLRGTDLRGCNFHLGSTRCGLVGSPYPSHGTRTGFYTDEYDEYDEQHFQSPEQIRKASLFGADLRNAKIDGVDFYLVDLREAKYDRSQERHLRSTGAILDNE